MARFLKLYYQDLLLCRVKNFKKLLAQMTKGFAIPREKAQSKSYRRFMKKRGSTMVARD